MKGCRSQLDLLLSDLQTHDTTRVSSTYLNVCKDHLSLLLFLIDFKKDIVPFSFLELEQAVDWFI